MCVKENVGEEGMTKEDGLMTVKERAWTSCEKSRVQLYEVKGHCSPAELQKQLMQLHGWVQI